MASDPPLTVVQRQAIRLWNELESRANEGRIEILISLQHGRRRYDIRPTPFYRLEPKEPISLAVDD